MRNLSLTAPALPRRSPRAETVLGPRRSDVGGSPWSLASHYDSLRQPQDGALTDLPQLAPRSARLPLDANVQEESNDARLSGTTRSLFRRVLGLNVMTAKLKSPGIQAQDRYYAEPQAVKAGIAPAIAASVSQRKNPDDTRLTSNPRTGRSA